MNKRMIYQRWFLTIILGCGLSLSKYIPVNAENPSDIPVELQKVIRQVDDAANLRDLERIKSFYSSQYRTTDGLTLKKLTEGVNKFWTDYPNLKYRTEILSWERKGKNLFVKILTTVTGNRISNGREIKLESTVKSYQSFQGNQIIKQEILSETTKLTSGERPPKVIVNLPLTVKVGEAFDFDVILSEPLEDNLLAGMAISEEINIDNYLNPPKIPLKLLKSGGLFKRIPAQDKPQDQWLSSILVRNDGITMITKRVKIIP